MIIITADDEDEARDLDEILGHHLVWPFRIYLDGAEFRGDGRSSP